ncbi:MAG: hypothetical protein A3F24_02370 [Candidatus Colwellbacteria bacterium RIFCSPHIGHO2_12_FULL_44_17]|uniref:Peptidase M24 domain-containing protein n=2 Tax=Candidatus Colwelliibacteriota TaxID=1817904 RepID=A0A1G1Z6T5_9BACT|nr:MAG: hypothetical protein A3F24_02370 [Candidatus Colwellbacteria bacterium RIFCSPHIGHO2_12_FULL_44_17]OGY60331.1 MAG: hypothetical protein A3I31_02585 [Candidatus Colwellbacteria bacterium RIFCSPLOWO2_02_FULL_44_20b]
MTTRIKKVQNELKKSGAGGIIITNETNVKYLTGFSDLPVGSRSGTLFITKDKAHLVIPTGALFEAQNLNSVKKKEIKLITIYKWEDRWKICARYFSSKAAVFIEKSDIHVDEWEIMRRFLKRKFKDARWLVERLRVVKDNNELKKIRKAVDITDKTFLETVKFLKSRDYTKLTERDVAAKIEDIAKRLGGEGLAFPSIVAVGKNSAETHHHSSNEKLKKNKPLLIDIGIVYKDYMGDLTRTIFLGKPSKEFKKIYKIVLEANEKSIAACHLGVPAQKLYEITVQHFKKYRLDKYFTHSLGHGVGLEIHEAPILRPPQKGSLKEKMVVTIEPGLYFKDKFGVRIEDYLAITKNGHEVLSSKSPKEKIIEI